MASQSSPEITKFLNRFATFCSLLATCFGASVLIAWAFHLPRLKTILPGQVAVKANTGACFILIGLALWLFLRVPENHAPRWRPAILGLSLLAAIVGGLSFLECCYGWDLGIDQLLFSAGLEDLPGSVRPGLMSPISASGFALLGLAIALRLVRIPWLCLLGDTLAGANVAISMFGLLDFVLDPSTTHTHIAPATALLLFVCSFAVLLSQKDRGIVPLLASSTSGGLMVRVLFPASVLVPIAIAWLRWKAQAAGLLSDWTGVSLMTAASATLLSAVTLWTGFAIDRSEKVRRRAEESVRMLA